LGRDGADGGNDKKLEEGSMMDCFKSQEARVGHRGCLRRGIASGVATTMFVLSVSAWGGEPPKEPLLRVEAGGMHTVQIRRIGIDAANRYLVTSSDGKTARVWDLATGRLLQILRPPVGPGNEGKLFAVAISPDGKTIAAAGWTGWDFDGSASIYLFDRATGQLTRRLKDLPSAIFQLVYTKDGTRLAALLGGQNGVRVYQTSDYALIGEDRDYGDQGYGASFDGSGRLVTTSWDGYVRLYDQSLHLVAKQKAPGGMRPYGIRFSPDGSKIAVGFEDAPKINVLSSQDLSLLYAPDTSQFTSWSLDNVAWSADGRLLYAGGKGTIGPNYVIRVWTDGGRGPSTDLNAANNTIMDIHPLTGGGFVYGTADPSFGIFDAQGRRTLFQGPPIADYRDNFEGFLVSRDGGTVQFGYEAFGKPAGRFSLASRLLEVDPAPNAALTTAVTSAPGLEITGWRNTYAPKFNGKPIPIDQYAIARSLAIAPDQQTFALGADWSLHVFDRSGREMWHVATPGVTWSVNVTGNGQTVVAAFGDGTIRWYRMRDGQELLAFFPHHDKKHWILWTPSGYYDASPGAEQLIGWHVNRGRDQAADFFAVGQFRDTYYRPDVVAKVLETLDEGGAIRAANAESGRKTAPAALTQQLPPVVMIVSPTDGDPVSNTEISVRFTIRSPSGEPVTAIKALVDGRPVATNRGVTVTSNDPSTQEMRVTVPEKDSEVAILAENRFAASAPAIVRVKWRGRAPSQEFVVKPKLYVLAIGVSAYQKTDLRLGFAAKDAKDFAAAVARQKGRLYRDVATMVLTDQQATKDEILDGLDWLRKETTSKDVAMVFLAGHGVNDQNGIYYFLPVNANPEKLMRTGIAFSDIKNTVSTLAGKTLAFVDTCHSGNIMGARRGAADITAMINELASAESGAIVFASSTGNQYSLEKPEWGNGAFTKALIEGFNGKADYTGKGKISINMLDLYLSERVKELTGGKQTPTTTKPQTIQDFPIALRP
jgi:WD40 repeat protein